MAMNNSLEHFVHDSRNGATIPNNIVWSCYVDKWQNVWIGTDHGLSRLSTHTYYRFTSLDKITFSGEGNCLHAILQTRSGDWWMGGTNGLIHYAEGVRVQGAASEYQNVVWYKQNNPSAPLAHNRVRKIYEDKEGDVWICTDHGINLYQKSTGKLLNFIVYDKTGKCMVAVSEGIHYADGTFVSEAKTSATDGFGHAQLGGLAVMLADTVKQATGAKVRGIELSLLQRCGSHLASKTDVDEAWLAGSAAVEAAVSGTTDKMVAFHCTRDNGEYHCEIALEPLDIVANFEKKVPREWINKEGNGVEQPFIDYVLPLIQGETEAVKESALPRFAHLKKVLTTSMK